VPWLQMVAVLGSCTQLGAWDASAAVPLSPVAGESLREWSTTVDIPRGGALVAAAPMPRRFMRKMRARRREGVPCTSRAAAVELVCVYVMCRARSLSIRRRESTDARDAAMGGLCRAPLAARRGGTARQVRCPWRGEARF
jgi:hypothetical protein